MEKREILKSSSHLKNSIKSITIGSFDGIHKAHQELIKRANGVVVIERGTATLTPGWKRSLYTKKPTFFYMLDKIKHLSPKEFVDMLQNHFINLEKITVGYDFTYGSNKQGNIETLKQYFKGQVEVVNEIKLNNISIHSRVIREQIKKNNIHLANLMLGREYRVDGQEIKGQGIGAKKLVPTINLKVINYTLPQGVFAIRAYINNTSFRAICFIGHRVSTDNNFAIEIHIIEEYSKENIKGRVWVEFIDFIRENKKFNSLNELKNQILKDIKIAKEILKTPIPLV